MMDKLLGVSLVVVAFVWTVNAVIDALVRYPSWYGVALAVCVSTMGCCLVASVVRDRL